MWCPVLCGVIANSPVKPDWGPGSAILFGAVFFNSTACCNQPLRWEILNIVRDER